MIFESVAVARGAWVGGFPQPVEKPFGQFVPRRRVVRIVRDIHLLVRVVAEVVELDRGRLANARS